MSERKDYTFNNREIASAAGRKSKRGPGKFNKKVKDTIATLAERLLEDVLENLDELDANQKANLMVKVVEYIQPRLKSVGAEITVANMSEQEMGDLLDQKLKEYYTASDN